MAQSFEYVAIYPPIGIARVGNSHEGQDEGWFITPEVPLRHREPEYDINLKDNNNMVKRQAVRFRVYAFDNEDRVIREITHDDGYNVEWTVHVANKKASWYNFRGRFKPENREMRNPKVPAERDRLNINPGPKSISGKRAPCVPLEGVFKSNKGETTEVYLGELQTDDKGRLIFLAGRGEAKCVDPDIYNEIHSDFNNEDWYDDTCDGEVSVMVKKEGNVWTSKSKETNAWVLGVGPKFAHDIPPTVSLYDLIEDINHQNSGDSTGIVNFHSHIGPLLSRPVLASWVNEHAKNGHGVGRPGYFLDQEKWWRMLSNPGEEAKTYRQAVFGRLRLPDTIGNVARKGQAARYFMPPLSGDGGDAIYGAPENWLSLTQLQYDRMKQWADGKFDNIYIPRIYNRVDDVETLEQQLDFLTEATLEMAAGGPFYPGIEISYNAAYLDTYRQPVQKPYAFRFNNKIKMVPNNVPEILTPGDITKPLSLPWHSDFYECNTHWWPATRPDDVVSEEEYRQWTRKSDVTYIPNLPRVKWDRGFRNTDLKARYYDGNTDMVNFWSKLGFIVEVPKPTPDVRIFVEKSRSFNYGAAQLIGGIKPPIKSLPMLKEHLQFAMRLELFTIPLYLYAMYSINMELGDDVAKRNSEEARKTILLIVSQEMLHLSLAGNILLAIGGQPKLYDKDIIPRYPGALPYRKDRLDLNLSPATINNIETFIEIERPETIELTVPETESGIIIYETIGAFYTQIKRGLSKFGNFEDPRCEYQFAPDQSEYPSRDQKVGLIVVKNLETAQKALDLIIEQGESGGGSHYFRFKDLAEMITESPLQCFPVPKNPRTRNYYDEKIKKLSLAFDATYSFLLKTIETLWHTNDPQERQKMVFGAMYASMLTVMAPLARFLVKQPMENGMHAAPCFEYYHSKEDNLKEDIRRLITEAIKLYAGNIEAIDELEQILKAAGNLYTKNSE